MLIVSFGFCMPLTCHTLTSIASFALLKKKVDSHNGYPPLVVRVVVSCFRAGPYASEIRKQTRVFLV